jgi:hypothetical protein
MAMRRFICAPAALLALLVVASADPASTAAAQASPTSEEGHVIGLVNAARAEKRLAALHPSEALARMARGQAGRMAAKGTIFHNPNLGPEATALGLVWRRLGENVGMGWNVDVVQEALIQSPRHYENIVRPAYNAIGVGVAHTDDRVFVAQVFATLEQVAKVTPPSLPATAPPAVPVRPVPTPPATATPKPVAVAAPTPARVRPWPDALHGGVVVREPIPLRLSDQRVRRQPTDRSFFAAVLDLVLPG